MMEKMYSGKEQESWSYLISQVGSESLQECQLKGDGIQDPEEMMAPQWI